jgi:hypothetical protein
MRRYKFGCPPWCAGITSLLGSSTLTASRKMKTYEARPSRLLQLRVLLQASCFDLGSAVRQPHQRIATLTVLGSPVMRASIIIRLWCDKLPSDRDSVIMSPGQRHAAVIVLHQNVWAGSRREVGPSSVRRGLQLVDIGRCVMNTCTAVRDTDSSCA